MMKRCRKCGGLVTAKYDGYLDILTFLCSCGYLWSDNPLDRPEEIKDSLLKVGDTLKD